MGIRARLGGAAAAVALVASAVLLPTASAQAANPPAPSSRWSFQTVPRPPPPPPTARPAAPATSAPSGSGAGKRIVYCVTCQRVWLIEANEAVSRTHRVSGRAGVPRKGTYSVFSKSERASSGSVTMRYMVRFARGRTLAIGFHSIPRNRQGRPIQSESELGSYRSHGCVRQSDGDALALWNFAPVGTKVVVT